MIFLFVQYRQEEAGTPCRVGGKSFIRLTQQAIRDRHSRTSLQGFFIGQELASADQQS